MSRIVQKTSDQESLESWARHPDAANLQTLVERYLGLVHSSALRRTGDAAQAAEVTCAVFLVLSGRSTRLRKNTVLAGWLFRVTALACRKLRPGRIGLLRRLRERISHKARPPFPPEANLWQRLAPQIDRALDRLRTNQRNAVLLCAFLHHDLASAAKILRTSERRVERRLQRGLKNLTNLLRLCPAPPNPTALAAACATEGCAAAFPEDLSLDIVRSIQANRGQPPSLKLARRTLHTLAWMRWRRRFLVGWATLSVLIALLGGIALYIDSFSGYSRLISEATLWSIRFWAWRVAESPQPWPTHPATVPLDATTLRDPQDLYRTTNIWLAHLSFTPDQWHALEFKRIDPMPHAIRPDGMRLMRNPQARRSGVLGVLGFEFDWTHANFEFGGLPFTNVAARVKGNLRSLSLPHRAYKVDLNKFVPGQKLAGLDELSFNSLLWDYSCLAEPLAYEFFRDAGLPAPRTAYAWLTTTVTTQWERKPLGLFVMVEAVDNEFVAARFGSKATPLFKPVTYNLFEFLGHNWSAYAPIYDLKTKADPEQRQRLIDFARLVSSAADPEFAARLGDFLDLDQFARFLAAQVLLPNYDGLLSNGQNFYLYLDPRSNKFGFIPWDLDAAWGMSWIATTAEEARASIWHPWMGQNRFLERLLALDDFRRLYRSHLEDFLARLYQPDRLHRRIDEIAAVIRPPIAAQSAFRLDKFEQTVGLKPIHPSPGENPNTLNWPAPDLKHFIQKRATSVRHQLDGTSSGLILKYPKGN